MRKSDSSDPNDSAYDTSAGQARSGWSRRGFLAGMGTAVAGGGVLGAAGHAAATTGPLDDLEGRPAELARYRLAGAKALLSTPEPTLPTNGDEVSYPAGVASFTKTLPHNELGEVSPELFAQFVVALESGRGQDIEALPGGGERKLANPRAAHCLPMSGGDHQRIDMPAVHSMSSARQAAEAAEVYWMAVTRDVAFADFDDNELTTAAAADLSKFSDFTAPSTGGSISTRQLFRGQTPGDLTGPYVSQFLLVDVPFGNRSNPQMAVNPQAGEDFMADYQSWLAIQNGQSPTASIGYTGPEHYIRTGRDLSEYVHQDFSYQAYLNAALICSSYGSEAVDPTPYSDSRREGGFLTFGGAAHMDLVARAAVAGLRPAWFHKWLVHRKIRPEGFGGRVHNQMTGVADYNLNEELLNSSVLDDVVSAQGNYLLAQAYPEGSPTHPSYPAGHATVAGSCVTVLKAIFNEEFVLPESAQVNRDGTTLEELGNELTLGGELNKLASNIALGRNMAGVHWRADGDDGLVAGEEAAIALLQDHLMEMSEDGGSFSFSRFDGTPIVVTATQVQNA